MSLPTPYYQSDRVTLYHGDCLEILPHLPKVDAVVTDPPYGIGIAANPIRQRHARKSWDNEPASSTVIDSIVSLSVPTIIWGGNYFRLSPSKGWLVWDKKQPENFTLAMAELAWTNMNRPVKTFRKHPSSYQKQHPTQKPEDLMEWCLKWLPNAGTVLDPFTGSGTTGVACIKTGRRFIGIEIDEKYCEIAAKRMQKAEQEAAEILTAGGVP